MNTQEIEQYLVDFEAQDMPKLIHRLLPTFSTRKINAIIGPRRAGKTSALFQVIKGFKNRKEALYLNFEHIQLAGITAKEILEIVELHKRLFQTAKPVLFLDEPQNVKEWEHAVRTLFDKGHNIFITGSSSKLLSKEIATTLRGRSISHIVLPFSFKEYLSFKGQEINTSPPTSTKTRILSMLDEYMEFGGFPEILLEEDISLKLKTLEQYVDLIVYKDIVERFNVKDASLVKWLIKAILSGYAKEFSINKLLNTLKSQGRTVNKNDLYEYVSMLNDSFFVLMLPRFSWSVRKREPISKAYICDTSFSKLVQIGKDTGKKMENVIFLHILATLKPNHELFYWKSRQQEYEVDFVVKEGSKVTALIQSCYDISNPDAKNRETRALLNAAKELNCNNLLMITDSFEGAEEKHWFGFKGNIKYIPLWKWLQK